MDYYLTITLFVVYSSTLICKCCKSAGSSDIEYLNYHTILQIDKLEMKRWVI
jgi:hypothetical protein